MEIKEENEVKKPKAVDVNNKKNREQLPPLLLLDVDAMEDQNKAFVQKEVVHGFNL